MDRKVRPINANGSTSMKVAVTCYDFVLEFGSSRGRSYVMILWIILSVEKIFLFG